MHGGFKREARAGGRFIEERGHDAFLEFHRAAVGHHVFHFEGGVKR